MAVAAGGMGDPIVGRAGLEGVCVGGRAGREGGQIGRVVTSGGAVSPVHRRRHDLRSYQQFQAGRHGLAVLEGDRGCGGDEGG